MKKLMIFCLVLTTLGLGSCKKFLTEYSQDEMRPSTTEDLSALLYSDGYPYLMPADNFDLITDDIQNNGLAAVAGVQVPGYVSPFTLGTPIFTFDKTMFDSNNTIPTGTNLYQIYYTKIKGCNVIIDYLDKVSGSAKDKQAILGQCLFLRSYYFFKLVNLYAKPYSGVGVNPETELGIALVLNSQVRDGGLSRTTLKATYDQIEKDLIQAEALLRVNFAPTSRVRVSAATANALLCRVYLYKGLESDWDKVISYANAVFADRSTLTGLSSLFNAANTFSGIGIYDPANSEVLWVYGYNQSVDRVFYPQIASGSIPPYTASNSLIALYEVGPNTSNYGDLRYQMYFNKQGTSPYFGNKGTLNSQVGTKGFRLAEVYLNRAEIYIKRFIKTGAVADRTLALADLNLLRANRYDTRNTAYTPVSITDGAALFTFYQNERRRELALEDQHRWMDIRRFGLGITHQYTAADGTSSTFTLQPNSPLYALPIPYTALAVNPDLVQNPR